MNNNNQKTINWFNTIFIFLFHIVGSIFAIHYIYTNGVSWSLAALTFFFYLITGISITAGYHRLFAHKSYEASPLLEYIYLLFGAAAYENSALKWCYDHRVHHKFVDENEDPYNVQRGFWHSHLGWILFDESRNDRPQYRRDLQRNKRVVWQDKHFLAISTFMSLILPTIIASFFGQALGGFLIAGIARITFVHHATFFINSLCHIWGKQNYTDKNSAKDNAILAFFTYGEGFHNFHHLFAKDYRNGIRWFHFDPTKWLIKFTALIGLAEKLTVTPREHVLLAKLAMKEKYLEQRLTINQKFSSELDVLKLHLKKSIDQWQVNKDDYTKALQKFKTEKTLSAKHNLVYLRVKVRVAKKTYMLAYKTWKRQYKYTIKYSLPA